MSQPDPKPGKEVVGIHVIKDMEERMELGFQRYKTYLQTHNGRDALQDLYEELIDATMYVKQCILENENGHMNANEYQNLAARTLIEKPDFQISDENLMIVWNAVGLAGEAGEIMELVKKGIFHQHGLDRGLLHKELGDLLWYVAALCTKLDFSMSEVMTANIEKLKTRYPNGYNSADSKRRVDIKKESNQ